MKGEQVREESALNNNEKKKNERTNLPAIFFFGPRDQRVGGMRRWYKSRVTFPVEASLVTRTNQNELTSCHLR
jgi:hypothetical protein